MSLDNSDEPVTQPTEPHGQDNDRLIERLDHLFRKAGDAPETRLIYQAVLEFQRNAAAE